jgi:hypothetical protein
LAALLLEAWTAQARAQPAAPDVDLTWNASPPCESREAVLAEVARVAGPPQGLRALRAPVRARVTVTSSALASWHAEVEVETPRGESDRAFDAESCGAVVSAVAIMVAVAADGASPAPNDAGSKSEPEMALGPRVPERRVAAPASAPPDSREDARSRFEGTLGAVLDPRSLPSFTAGGEIGAGWTLRRVSWRFRAVATATLLVPRSTVLASGEGASFWLFGGSGRVCAAGIAGRIDVGPCAAAEVDTMWASAVRGPGPSFRAENGNAVWWAVGGSVIAAVAVSDQVGVFVRGDGLVPLARPTFIVDRAQPALPLPVYRAPSWTARAALGVETRFF